MLLAYHTTSIHEVPNEVALVLGISECPNLCEGCHSPELRLSVGEPLDDKLFKELLGKYKGLITCVCFMGGEWYNGELKYFLTKTQIEYGMKTCLYTKEEKLHSSLMTWLDYVKLGDFRQDLGGLESPTTNQRFIRLCDDVDLTESFQHTV